MNLFTFPFKAMGTPCELRLYASEKKFAEQVANIATTELQRLEVKYSRYRDDNVTSKINIHAGKEQVAVDKETELLLNYANVGFEQSDGLFDITSGILRKAWNFRSEQIPDQSQIDDLLPLIGWQVVQWDPPNIFLPSVGMEIDFGGYVKEYAVDVAANICRREGIVGGLVNLGGDICVIGPHPDEKPWTIGIRNPRDPENAIAYVQMSNGGLASSGDYERCMTVDGVRYSHILNPKTGWPINSMSSVSVVADQCVVAGTSSTIAMLKGNKAGRDWLQDLGLPFLAMDQELNVFGTLKTDQ